MVFLSVRELSLLHWDMAVPVPGPWDSIRGDIRQSIGDGDLGGLGLGLYLGPVRNPDGLWFFIGLGLSVVYDGFSFEFRDAEG